MDVTDTRGVRRITFDRPASMNAMTADVARDLAAAVEATGPDSHDAVVITGQGEAFSAGGDVEAMAEREETTAEARERLETSFGRIVEAVTTAPLPVVARVNGDAVGAGMSVAALADFAYAAESARFGAAFVRVGLIPDTGGTFLLPRLVGLREAKRLAFTGDLIPAEEAAEIGLVNEAVPDDELDDRIDDLLVTLRERPTRTIGLAKRAIHENLGRGWRESLDYELATQAEAYGTQEHREGVEAFLNR